MNLNQLQDLKNRLDGATDLADMLRIDLELRLSAERDEIQREVDAANSLWTLMTDSPLEVPADWAHIILCTAPVRGPQLTSAMAYMTNATHIFVDNGVWMDLLGDESGVYQPPKHVLADMYFRGFVGPFPVGLAALPANLKGAFIRSLSPQGVVQWSLVEVTR